MTNPEGIKQSIKGKAIGTGENLDEQVKRVLAAARSAEYEHKVYTLTADTDRDMSAATPDAPQASNLLFENIKRAHFMVIRTDQDITIKLNSASNDPIPLTVAEGGVMEEFVLEMTNIFITTTALSTVVKIRIS